MLDAHYTLGLVVLLLALFALFLAPARRLVLYVLAVQIVFGAILWAQRGAPPPAHWILALAIGGVYALANALERRGRPRAAVVGVLVLAVVIVACVFYLGMRAVAS